MQAVSSRPVARSFANAAGALFKKSSIMSGSVDLTQLPKKPCRIHQDAKLSITELSKNKRQAEPAAPVFGVASVGRPGGSHQKCEPRNVLQVQGPCKPSPKISCPAGLPGFTQKQPRVGFRKALYRLRDGKYTQPVELLKGVPESFPQTGPVCPENPCFSGFFPVPAAKPSSRFQPPPTVHRLFLFPSTPIFPTAGNSLAFPQRAPRSPGLPGQASSARGNPFSTCFQTCPMAQTQAPASHFPSGGLPEEETGE